MEDKLFFDLLPKETLYAYTKMVVDLFMIFGPSVGYFAQAIKFQQTKSSAGFSKYMCLILLFANILRIFFWIGKRFTIVLLYQSLVVISSQFYLIYYCLKYDNTNSLTLPTINEKEEINQLKTAKMSIIARVFDVKKFWMWERMVEYYLFTIFFVITIIFMCKVLGFENQLFINIIGAISAFSESVIAIPQIKANYIKKDVSNLSTMMVLLWLLGDTFKTFYYIFSSSPKQLIVCGFLQVSLDVTLTFQLYVYNKKQASLNTTPMKNIEETLSLIKNKDNHNNVDENDEEDININIGNSSSSITSNREKII